MKIGIFNGVFSVRSKNIFSDISRHPTGKDEINEDLSHTGSNPFRAVCISAMHLLRNFRFVSAVRCFDNIYVGKQSVAWKEYYVEYWFKELQESMDRCTGRRDITEIPLKNGVNTINQSVRFVSV